jgi:hypothetical protein
VTEPELILRPSRWKHMLVAATCLLFACIGVLMIRDGRVMGWAVAGVFAVGLLVSLVQLLPSSSYLRLTSEGFGVRNLFRSHRYRWSDVTAFGVGRIAGNKMVVFDFAEGYTGQRAGRALATAISGVEGALPDTYGRSAEALAELLNDWREEALRA